MLKITQHIERLLLHNDCVIVPDFGGFVVQECCARYVEEEGIFLPPYRGVIFNPRLTSNDGLLVDAVARDRAITYHEAATVVKGEVEELRSAIGNQGSYTISGIGTLSTHDGGSYEFEPIACGIVAPALHGLDSYYVPLYHAKGEHMHKDEETQLASQEVVTIRLRRSHLRHIAVAAVACLFFILTVTTGHFSIQHDKVGEAGILQQWWTAMVENLHFTPQTLPPVQLEPTTLSSSKPERHTPAIKVKESVTPPATAATPSAQEQEAAIPQGFTIVVASAIPLANANTMVAQWNDHGLPKTAVLESGRMVRVVCGTFTSEEEARAALSQYRSQYEEFAEAWIFHIP